MVVGQKDNHLWVGEAMTGARAAVKRDPTPSRHRTTWSRGSGAQAVGGSISWMEAQRRKTKTAENIGCSSRVDGQAKPPWSSRSRHPYNALAAGTGNSSSSRCAYAQLRIMVLCSSPSCVATHPRNIWSPTSSYIPAYFMGYLFPPL